jgi:hypothetical protein
MSKTNDLEGPQDQGGKHGGQAGMPIPETANNPKTGLPKPDNKGEVVGNPTVRKP